MKKRAIRSAEQERLFEASGSVVLPGKLEALLYLLMRDHVPPGVIGDLMRDLSAAGAGECSYTNGWLARYAEHVAGELRQRCSKCHDSGLIPPTEAVQKSKKLGGQGGTVCDCAAGKAFHDSWQGLVSPELTSEGATKLAAIMGRPGKRIPKLAAALKATGCSNCKNAGCSRCLSRAEEKAASRAEDERALRTGEKTPDELRAENAHFARLKVRRVGGRLS